MRSRQLKIPTFIRGTLLLFAIAVAIDGNELSTSGKLNTTDSSSTALATLANSTLNETESATTPDATAPFSSPSPSTSAKPAPRELTEALPQTSQNPNSELSPAEANTTASPGGSSAGLIVGVVVAIVVLVGVIVGIILCKKKGLLCFAKKCPLDDKSYKNPPEMKDMYYTSNNFKHRGPLVIKKNLPVEEKPNIDLEAEKDDNPESKKFTFEEFDNVVYDIGPGVEKVVE
ncbi:hypothetical protein L596_007605 [Steinernema carpocapsae]|uniref:Syndecan/Neurexin domain-containing protein n=1 Tax=Steinernema carpocapsae TaxID=34508 RepID=A0A4U5P9X1_STECR|nr:hypothetical protein L596_007605 [Steinernema carpocapsae]